MTLYLIGLGLNDEKDISVKGLEAIKKCDLIYLENYTSKLNVDIKYLEKLYDKKIILADRSLVEENQEVILKEAHAKNIALLIMGDVFSATTHIDLFIAAQKNSIPTKIIHNASIVSAIGVTGLQIYKFGKITSIPFDNDDIEAPYDILKDNLKINAHTLFLLDLKSNENKFLSVNDAIRYLLKVEIKRHEKIFSDNTLCVGCSKIGSLDQKIIAAPAKELLKRKFDGPQCLIVPSKLHFKEEEALQWWK